MISKLRVTLFFVAIVAWTGAAQAIPLTWNLVDVVFEDESTASGSFDYDADSNTFSNIYITTGAGNTYEDVNPYSSGNGGLISLVSEIPVVEGVTQALLFDLDGAMTNLGGTIDILPGSTGGGPLSLEGTCVSGQTTIPCASVGSRIFVLSGQITTAQVPAPATLALLLIGLVGLGFRKKSV